MKAKNLAELLELFDNTLGVSGAEEEIAACMRGEMEGCYDDWMEDPLGNQIWHKKGKKDSSILLAAHMDELGFMVSYIEENGVVRFIPVGLHDDRMVIDQDLIIHTAGGNAVRGVTGGKPSHILTDEERKHPLEIPELFLDVGTFSREETEGLGVQIGDFISFDRKGQFLNGSPVYTGKAVDNRSGCAIMVEVMRRVKAEGIDNVGIYAVGTVQEELGIRGAGVAGHRVQPDVALALDVTLAGGTPGIEERQVPIRLGGGAAIKLFDWAPASNLMGNAVPRKLTGKLLELAEDNSIPYQREILMGGSTDAWTISLSGNGVLTGAISIPSRYIHSAVGVVHLGDMQACVDLILAYIKSL